jgi:hypothetical protein
MFNSLPKIRVGEPLRHEALSFFPLFVEAESHVEYQLSDAALADKSLRVEEISEGGSVPELLVENTSDLRVLFLEGEELVGAKQNRVLNTWVLVPAHAKSKITVSCVERGRWGYRLTACISSQRSPTASRGTITRKLSVASRQVA